jgi:hypothetical protein
MMRITGCFSLICCLLINLAQFTLAGADNAAAIPGQSIGQIEIGASRTTIHRLLGKASKSYRRGDGLRRDNWSRTGMINSEEAIIFISVLFRNGKVVQIETNDPSYAPEGVHMDIGPSLPSIRQHYKNLQLLAYRYEGKNVYIHRYYDDVKNGMAFSYLYDRDGEKSTPNAIIVHRAGRYVIPQAGGKRIKLSR